MPRLRRRRLLLLPRLRCFPAGGAAAGGGHPLVGGGLQNRAPPPCNASHTTQRVVGRTGGGRSEAHRAGHVPEGAQPAGGAPSARLIKAVNIITRTSHYVSLNMSGTGYIRNDGLARGSPAPRAPPPRPAASTGRPACTTARRCWRCLARG
jgi:hypothetical protein